MNTRGFRSTAVAALFLATSTHGAVYTVINTNDSGPGSLRQAMLDANATTELDYIQFSIPGAGPHTISPLTSLPTITSSMVIDGYTQPGAKENTSPAGCNAVLKIELNGAFAGSPVSGLSILSAGPGLNPYVTVRGLAINRFSDAGIYVGTPSSSQFFEGNFIGTDPSGLIARPNGTGFLLRSVFPTVVNIGGGRVSARNIISGNYGSGINTGGVVTGSNGPRGSVVGNLIGVDCTGLRALPNGGDGIQFNTYAGALTIAGNVISGNVGNGIDVTHRTAAAGEITGNAIGTDASGTIAIGNGGVGASFVGAGALAFGGFAPGDANIIAANGGSGILAYTAGGGFNPNVPWNGNAVFGNGGLQLNLSGNDLPSGVTTNDVGDLDSGPNGLQNFPVLASVYATNGGFAVNGALGSRSNSGYQIDFYRSPAPDPSGHGGGKNHFGTTNVTTDGTGNASFVFFTTAPLQGQWITAIARDTNANNAASEFSQAISVAGVFGGNVQFNSVGTVVNESDGVVSLQLVRTDSTNGTVTVTYSALDGTAIAGSDYTAVTTSVTFAAGETNKIITVPILNDTSGETLENFSVILTGVSGDGALGLFTNATVNIVDDDPLPQLSINDVSMVEGNAGTSFMIFTVSLSAPSSESVSVTYATSDGTATVFDIDYVADANVLVFAPGETEKPLPIAIKGDTLTEGDDIFYVTLFSATNAAVARFQGVGTILNDDPLPKISITDQAVNEGNSGSVTVPLNITMSRPSALTLQFDFGTEAGTASAGTDFIPTNGTIRIAPGVNFVSVPIVVVLGDLVYEPSETIFVNLSNAVNATLESTRVKFTIANDDPPPSALSINNISVTEGISGSTFAAFAVSLTPASTVPVSVSFASSNGTAVAPADYTATSGTLSFNPGETVKPVTVTIKGDTNPEPNETFFINLSSPSNATFTKAQGVCTILNDDEPVLGIQLLTGETILFWPTNYEGFQLYCVTNLGSSNSWMPVSGSLATTNGTNSVMELPTAPAKFYRLQAP